jgi:hypothetical protein
MVYHFLFSIDILFIGLWSLIIFGKTKIKDDYVFSNLRMTITSIMAIIIGICTLIKLIFDYLNL